MVSSFMGRQKIYCRCLEKNDFVLLNEALIKNVYRNVKFYNDSPEKLTNYCQKIHNSFINEKEDYFFLDKFIFPKL